jgi:hypothetical protein
MIVFLNQKYPAKPEEVASLETTLKEPWDTNNHIEILFQSIKEGCETLIRMNAIAIADVDSVIIWTSASYLEHIPMIPMKCRPLYLSYISHILSTYL